ncbi:MAG: DUF4468 domain-containing protein [Bacteroidales bacterium]|nr:DUF4468 domain-containing protein [Bacteroidales bacterium]
MKKQIITIVAALFSAFALHAQSEDIYGAGAMPIKDGKVFFSETVEQEQTADMLYTAAKSAITDMFVSAKDVIQMADKESHTIIAKGINKIATVKIDFTIKIQTKEGRYRISMYDIKYTATSPNLPPSVIFAEELTDEKCLNGKGECKRAGNGYARRSIIDTKNSIFRSLESKMASVKADTEEDW